jgi:uncharacterized protein YjbI with pentapeptide repeats
MGGRWGWRTTAAVGLAVVAVAVATWGVQERRAVSAAWHGLTDLAGRFFFPLVAAAGLALFAAALHDRHAGRTLPVQEKRQSRTPRDWVQLATVATAVIAAVGAMAYNGLSLNATREQIKITEEGHLTDRFSKAIEQLGSTTSDVRLGGIYALERVMRDSPADQPTIMEVLAAFIRDHAPRTKPAPNPVATALPRTDIQAALTVLGRRNPTRDNQTRIDLHDTVLSGADLRRAKLRSANLAGVNLSSANLGSADLVEADLRGANLRGAELSSVDLRVADLRGADLRGASLFATSLYAADLRDANVSGADLDYAYVRRADLRGANLSRANLSNADLRDADLSNTDLRGANLRGAHLPPGFAPSPTTTPR